MTINNNPIDINIKTSAIRNGIIKKTTNIDNGKLKSVEFYSKEYPKIRKKIEYDSEGNIKIFHTYGNDKLFGLNVNKSCKKGKWQVDSISTAGGSVLYDSNIKNFKKELENTSAEYKKFIFNKIEELPTTLKKTCNSISKFIIENLKNAKK